MTEDQHLTVFQMSAEAALREALQAIGSELIERRTVPCITSVRPDGEPEAYIHARVRGSDAEVRIYFDGAELSGPTTDRRFEAPDYENGEALARAFVAATIAHLTAPRSRPESN